MEKKLLKDLAETTENVNITYPFRSQRNAKNLPRNYEKNNDPSKTIPDQTLSISEILKRYASGLPLEGARVPIYNGEEPMPDTRRMDLSEIEELKRQNAEFIKEQREKMQKADDDRKILAAAEKIRKQKEAEEKSNQTNSDENPKPTA